ncbi:translocation/assembly module TamB domain-containing protein [Emticicia sp. SJ17W-69]|uniref:translocation/assembly module TamB domain-containing protein n=1 Tax=Emticicia sp. SJ17W-69 TaxID=3421657 RepID=UPI003EBD7E4C
MRRLLRIIGWLLVGISLLFGGLFIFLESSIGQDFLTKQVVSYLHTKLKTKIEIEKVRFHIPDWISLENVYVQDLQKDTLIAGKKIYIDVDMLALLQNKVAINQVELQGIRVKINRTLPDTTFNFNFIVQAFDTPSKAKDTTTTPAAPLEIGLKKIKLSNVNVSYKDAILGTDADANLRYLETEFDKFNFDKSQYHFAKINGDGGTVSLNLYKPLRPSTNVETTHKNPSDTLDFSLKKISLANLNWSFESAEDGIKNKVKLGKFEAEGNGFYLEKQQVGLKSILLENTETLVEFNKKPQKPNNPESKPNNWAINIAKIQVKNNSIRYDDFNTLTQAKGLDASHLNVKNLGLTLNNFVFSPKLISGQLDKATFNEHSGLIVQNISSDFSYTDKQISFKKLLVKTPNTLLQDEVLMQYNSVDDFTKNLGKVKLKLNLKKSQLAVKDLFILVPDLAKNASFKGRENDIIKVDGIVSGTVNNLSVPKLNVDGFGETHLQINGRILGLPNTDKLGLDLNIGELSMSKKDILQMAGDSAIPKSIELPEFVKIKGSIKGKIQDLVIDAALDSEFGGASFKGSLGNITADKNQKYDGRIIFQDFDLGKLTKQPETVGKLTLDATIKGTGFDPKTMQASVEGTAQKASIKGYEYSNLALKGSIKDQNAIFDASITDQNSKIRIVGRANLADEYPAIVADVSIDELDLKKLNFYAENLKIQGDIRLNMTSTNPENPLGEILINKAVSVKDGKRIPLDKVSLNFKTIDNQRDITLKSPFFNAHINGKFNYVQIADILLTEVNKYFALPAFPYTPITNDYSLKVDATLNNHPIIQSFIPEITKLDTIKVSATLNNKADTTLNASFFIPFVEYDTSTVNNARFKIFGTNNKAKYEGNIAQVIYDGYRVRRAFIGGEVSNNVLSLNLIVKDSLNANRYGFAGNLRSIDDKLRLNLSKNGTLIDYRKWESDSTGFIDYSPKGVYIKDLVLKQDKQKLLINSLSPEPNSPLQIQIDSLVIKPFVTIATLDSTLASGTLNGSFKLSNYMTSPEFTGDLAIQNFAFTQIPIGNLSVTATNETSNKINVKAALVENNNNIHLDGNYLLKSKQPLDFKIDINKLGAKTVEAFSFGQLKNASGNLDGILFLKGEPSKPVIDGEIKFDTVSFSLAQLGAKYRIQNQSMGFKNSFISFNKFIIADTLGQNLLVNGSLSLQNLPNYSYKLDIDTKNFMALNGSRKDNDFFYGKGFIDANLSVKGVGTKPAIEGNIKLKNGSDITVIMPDREIDKAETDGIVQFVNLKNPSAEVKADSLDSENAFDFVEEVSLNIEVDDKSQLTVIVDELNGDNIKVKGNAQLNTGITPSGQAYVLGLYELTSGSYDLSFQFLKKQFIIEKGSSLLWTGDPMQAQIDITAAYKIVAEVPKVDANAKALGKVPLDVLLKMSGNLSNPIVDFDIRVDANAPSDISDAIKNDGYLATLKQNQVDMNKQVFALLVLNRFLTEQSTDFFSGINPEAIARQSVSKLLSDQLNLLAGDLIKGIKLDFNLNSTAVNTEGVNKAKTDLNVGLSKAFLNDRLKIAVGRNFQLENTTGTASSNEIVDNISLNYNLSKDGRYLFSAYRKNQYQAILDGFVVATGVSFSITLDYEYFKELFQKKK